MNKKWQAAGVTGRVVSGLPPLRKSIVDPFDCAQDKPYRSSGWTGSSSDDGAGVALICDEGVGWAEKIEPVSR